MLLAVMLLFTFTQVGFIQFGPLAATLMHIPVLIGLIMEGLPVGLGLGAAFGVISLIRAFVVPTATSFVLQNPIISVLPRLLFPLIAWLAARAVARAGRRNALRETLSTGAAGFCGAAANTALVLSLIFFIYGERYGLAMKTPIGIDALPAVLLTTALTNGLPEAVVAAILVPAVTGALRRAGLAPKGIA
jgi:uncharacterized membrane protein